MFFFVIQQETVSSLLAYTPRRALSAAQVKGMWWKTDWCTVCMVQGKVGGWLMSGCHGLVDIVLTALDTDL